MRKAFIGTLAAALVLVGLPVGAGPVVEVKVHDVPDGGFEPDVVTTKVFKPGASGVVHWSRAAGANDRHNVAEPNGLFRSGDPTLGDIDFTRQFSGGKFDVICQFHGSIMSAVIKVKLRHNADPEGLPFTVRWAHADSNTGEVFDVQYKVDDEGGFHWNDWKSDTAKNKGVFGLNGNPIEVEPGHTYRFRARSQKASSTPGAYSRWSPVLVVVT